MLIGSVFQMYAMTVLTKMHQWSMRVLKILPCVISSLPHFEITESKTGL